MIIGVPKEIKVQEYRVGLVPAGVKALVDRGHKVLVETRAGVGCGNPDEEYVRWGAEIVDSAGEVWDRAEMIVKVKEPIAQEYPLFKDGQVQYTYFHLAAAVPELASSLIEKNIASVAYETIELADGSLPLLRGHGCPPLIPPDLHRLRRRGHGGSPRRRRHLPRLRWQRPGCRLHLAGQSPVL